MSTETTLPPTDEATNHAPIGFTRGPFVLYATIKKTSKYYHQGLDDHQKPRAFEIKGIDDCGEYRFRGNHNVYRADDLTFWIKNSEGKFTKIR